jgi:hypothetical protein
MKRASARELLRLAAGRRRWGNKMSSFVRISIAAILMASATPAFAQASRTWVSGVGDDANPCSRTAPCKTFAGAISKTASGGEIDVIDPGGFGALTITKSITIDGHGPLASVLVAGTNGIVISGSGITVTLRNLSINGFGNATGNGIKVLNAAAVNVDHVTIQNFAGSPPSNGRGIAIETSTPDVRVTVTNSDLYNNFGIGIHSNPTTGNVILVVDNVRVAKGDFSSIQLRANTNASINRSTLTNSRLGAGVTSELSGVTANVSNSVLSNNAVGVFNGVSGGAPTTILYNNVITGNTSNGLQINSGSVLSYGNNAIRGNAGNETPTGAAIPTR